MRVLLIEDEKSIAKNIRIGLEQEIIAVDLAYDGEEGYELARDGGYDVIVVDWMLPLMDGLSLVAKLREEGDKTPILILTARVGVPDKVEGLNAGADDYLTKPFAFEEFLARIWSLSRRSPEIRERVLRVGGIEINTSQGNALVKGKEVKLSRREFMLLNVLMNNIGSIVSKDQLMNHVWGYEADVFPNTIEVFISKLRKKIDGDLAKNESMIETVRGFGYRMRGK